MNGRCTCQENGICKHYVVEEGRRCSINEADFCVHSAHGYHTIDFKELSVKDSDIGGD